MRTSTFTLGGIHPPQSKFTAGFPIKPFPLPKRAVVMLSQHIGAPADPVVKVGDTVMRGDLIASAHGFVSASIHSPISGTVKAINLVQTQNGYSAPAIIIEATDEQHQADTIAREAMLDRLSSPSDRGLSESLSADDIRKAVASAGIVGLGGATFPSVVKLSTKPDSLPEFIVINACECEPYLTCDDALMRAYPGKIIEGIELMLKATGAKQAIIGIERNKPEAIAALRAAINPEWPISLVPLKTKYPQGGEKQLVEAVTGRRIPSGALPAAVGAVVNNVATAFAVYQAVKHNIPLTDRVITVTGDVPNPGNYYVAVGTSISELVSEPPSPAKVIIGGPMMGRAAINLETPVTKGTSGLLVIAGQHRQAPQPCIRCASCVNACPMGLEPYLLSTYGRKSMFDQAEKGGVMDCIECGSCSYVCPSSRPLLDFIRVAKSAVAAEIRARKSK